MTAMTAVPTTRPTLVMISMGDSNAYADPPPVLDGVAARPEPHGSTLWLRH
jgi:hypothetical protein